MDRDLAELSWINKITFFHNQGPGHFVGLAFTETQTTAFGLGDASLNVGAFIVDPEGNPSSLT